MYMSIPYVLAFIVSLPNAVDREMIPRDRNGEYAPQIVRKHQTDISEIEDEIIFLYSQRTSTRDIERTMREMHRIKVDATRVTKITDKLLPMIREWQKPAVGSDICHGHAGRNSLQGTRGRAVMKKAVYIAIGTDLEGKKDVLGLWTGATESAKYWLSVLNGLKSCGVQDILIVSVDGLTGFSEAISVAYPRTEIQRCIVHQIRSSTRMCPTRTSRHSRLRSSRSTRRRRKTPLGGSGRAGAGLGAKYPASIKLWRDHWDELATMFKYPEQIRRIIYTTNAIENFNRQLRKVTKTKGAFASDDALPKQLYLVTAQTTDKWTMPIKDWGQHSYPSHGLLR